MTDQYLELDVYSADNTAVPVGDSEAIQNVNSRYNTYNRLLVQNLDAVDIEVRLDQLNIAGQVFRVGKNGGYLVIEPEAGRYFRSVQNVNLDTANAEVAGKIIFRFAYAVKVN